QCRKNPDIHLFDLQLQRLGQATFQLDRYTPAGSPKLSLMQKAHPGQAQNEQRGCAMLGEGKHGGDARLVVVFQKMSAGGDELRQLTQQVMVHSPGIACHEFGIQRLIVSEIETESLQTRLESPINLRQEKKIRVCGFNGWDGCS